MKNNEARKINLTSLSVEKTPKYKENHFDKRIFDKMFLVTLHSSFISLTFANEIQNIILGLSKKFVDT